MNIELIDLIGTFEEQQGSLNMILDLIPVPIFAKDIQGRYLTCNAAFEEFIGITRPQMIGKGVYDLWPQPQADVYCAKDKELFENPGLQKYESSVIKSSDRENTVQFHKVTFLDANGQVAGLLGVIFDRTQEKNLENELKHLALIDTVTGLLNRRAGIDAINRLLAESARNKGIFSIAMMDIDHFERINDMHGHGVGDRVLKSVQEISTSVLREYDFIFRYGGEEFMLCFPDSSIEKAQIITERLREAFENNKIEGAMNDTVQITVSIGVASYPQHGDDLEKLTKACDDALYAAKHNGRNNVKPAL